MIANKIVEEYMANQLETKSEGARRAAEWLETRLAELGDTVKSLEQDVDQRRAEIRKQQHRHRVAAAGRAHQSIGQRADRDSSSRGALRPGAESP